MRKVVVYCHGLNSSARTDKFYRLRDNLPECDVFAWDIHVDPDISIVSLIDHVDMEILLENPLEEEINLIFVGTSLGGWYASKLADVYGAKAILINPSYNPSQTLESKGIDKHIADKYSPIFWSNDYRYLISRHDEVIDFTPVSDDLARVNAKYYEHTDHRFNGPEFDDVINLIREM